MSVRQPDLHAAKFTADTVRSVSIQISDPSQCNAITRVADRVRVISGRGSPTPSIGSCLWPKLSNRPALITFEIWYGTRSAILHSEIPGGGEPHNNEPASAWTGMPAAIKRGLRSRIRDHNRYSSVIHKTPLHL